MVAVAARGKQSDSSVSRRSMFAHLISYEVRRSHAGTALGMGWTVLQPLLLLGCYFFLFAVLRVPTNAPEGTLGKVAVILSGIVPWLFFMRCFSNGLGALPNHAQLVRQINFPIGVLPFVTVGIFTIDFLVGIAMLLVVVVAQGWLGWGTLLLIPATIVQAAFLTGLTAMLAPLGVMLRDARNLLPVIVRLGLFLSPVLYIPGTIPGRFQWVMYVNPMTYFIGLVRFGTFGTTEVPIRATAHGTEYAPLNLLPPAPTFAIALACALATAIGGYLCWGYARRVAVDYL